VASLKRGVRTVRINTAFGNAPHVLCGYSSSSPETYAKQSALTFPPAGPSQSCVNAGSRRIGNKAARVIVCQRSSNWVPRRVSGVLRDENLKWRKSFIGGQKFLCTSLNKISILIVVF
jgi:hypothetical protein